MRLYADGQGIIGMGEVEFERQRWRFPLALCSAVRRLGEALELLLSGGTTTGRPTWLTTKASEGSRGILQKQGS
jgi:hypothetical protein